MSHCTGCGQALDHDSRFCVACGQAVAPGSIPPAAASPPPVAPAPTFAPPQTPTPSQVSSPTPAPAAGVPPYAQYTQTSYPPAGQQAYDPYAGSQGSQPPPKKGVSKGLIVGLSLGAGALVVAGVAAMLIGGPDNRLVDAHASCQSEDPAWAILYSTLSDDGTALYMEGSGSESLGVSVGYQVCVLRDLDAPATVYSRMDSTSALMGVQTASWDGIEANWTYHPRRGLDIYLELE